LQSLDNQIASADATLARFGQQLASIPSREIEVARLAREQKLLGDVAVMLQTRLKEAEIQNALDAGNVQVVDTALRPSIPIAPNPIRNMILALFVGLVLGVGTALGKEALDTKVRSDEDVRFATGGMPLLATIPRIRTGTAVTNGRRTLPATASSALQDRLVTSLEPHSPASEAYRMLRTSVSFAGMGSDARVMVVTSAMPGDGKSTCSSNLAITLAQQGIRTILVDSDLRKGLLHQVFGLSQEPGLSHLLVGATSLESAVRQVTVGNVGVPLDVLPSGIFPPNPSELLASARMRDLLGALRDEYEMVIIDAPPLNLVTDAAVLSSMSDGTLLVTRSGVTDKRALSHAAAQLRRVNPAISGVVLNALDITRPSYGNQFYTYGYYAAEHAAPGGNGNGKSHKS
jgi:tyrosine-protein kinase Etk/Wzc